MRRAPSQRRPPTAPAPGRPKPPQRATVAPATPVTGAGKGDKPLLPQVLEWASWIVIWVSAIAAGWFLGAIPFSKGLFMFGVLAITVLAWLWVRLPRAKPLEPSRIAGLQGALALLVAFVLTLSGTYVVAAAVLVVELPLAVTSMVVGRRARSAAS